MTDKVMSVHTHEIAAGARCGDFPDAVCAPLEQAVRKRWLYASRTPVAFYAVGDMELCYLSVFNFCPFCGVKMTEAVKGYLRNVQGPEWIGSDGARRPISQDEANARSQEAT